MARAKFKTPEPVVPEVEVAAGRPTPVARARYLREKATGILHPYTADIAARGDLVEAYDGDVPPGGVVESEGVSAPEPEPSTKAKAKPKPKPAPKMQDEDTADTEAAPPAPKPAPRSEPWVAPEATNEAGDDN